MLELRKQMDLQESAVQVDLLNLAPTDPDGGSCCGRHSHGPEQSEV